MTNSANQENLSDARVRNGANSSWTDYASALSGLVIAAAAFYGVLFSEISERWLDSLQAELQETKKDLEILRTEEREIVDRIKHLRNERDQYQSVLWAQALHQFLDAVENEILTNLDGQLTLLLEFHQLNSFRPIEAEFARRIASEDSLRAKTELRMERIEKQDIPMAVRAKLYNETRGSTGPDKRLQILDEAIELRRLELVEIQESIPQTIESAVKRHLQECCQFLSDAAQARFRQLALGSINNNADAQTELKIRVPDSFDSIGIDRVRAQYGKLRSQAKRFIEGMRFELRK